MLDRDEAAGRGGASNTPSSARFRRGSPRCTQPTPEGPDRPREGRGQSTGGPAQPRSAGSSSRSAAVSGCFEGERSTPAEPVPGRVYSLAKALPEEVRRPPAFAGHGLGRRPSGGATSTHRSARRRLLPGPLRAFPDSVGTAADYLACTDPDSTSEGDDRACGQFYFLVHPSTQRRAGLHQAQPRNLRDNLEVGDRVLSEVEGQLSSGERVGA